MRLAHAGHHDPGPRPPRNAHRIWLVTSVVTVLVVVFVAVKLAGTSCPVPPRSGGSAVAGPGITVGPGVTAGRAGAGHAAEAGSAAASPMAARPRPATPAVRGHAVFYDPGRAAGSCGLGPFPGGGWYASLPPRSYASGRACGSYLDVAGPSGTVRAEVVDVCTDCAARTVDLSRAAFARLADPGTGTVAVSYRPAVDPPLAGPLVLRITAAGGPGTLAVQVINHGNRLSSVSASRPGGRWLPLVPGAGGYWTGPLQARRPAAGAAPGGAHRAAAARRISLRITDVEGHQVVLTGIPPRSTVVNAAAWMYPAGIRPAPPASRSPVHPAPGRRAGPAVSAGSCAAAGW